MSENWRSVISFRLAVISFRFAGISFRFAGIAARLAVISFRLAARVRFSAMDSYLTARRRRFAGKFNVAPVDIHLALTYRQNMSSSLRIAAQCCCSLLRRVRLEHGLRW
jgi:hypothetical protein